VNKILEERKSNSKVQLKAKILVKKGHKKSEGGIPTK